MFALLSLRPGKSTEKLPIENFCYFQLYGYKSWKMPIFNYQNLKNKTQSVLSILYEIGLKYAEFKNGII